MKRTEKYLHRQSILNKEYSLKSRGGLLNLQSPNGGPEALLMGSSWISTGGNVNIFQQKFIMSDETYYCCVSSDFVSISKQSLIEQQEDYDQTKTYLHVPLDATVDGHFEEITKWCLSAWYENYGVNHFDFVADDDILTAEDIPLFIAAMDDMQQNVEELPNFTETDDCSCTITFAGMTIKLEYCANVFMSIYDMLKAEYEDR